MFRAHKRELKGMRVAKKYEHKKDRMNTKIN